jgi:hypothetical protein
MRPTSSASRRGASQWQAAQPARPASPSRARRRRLVEAFVELDDRLVGSVALDDAPEVAGLEHVGERLAAVLERVLVEQQQHLMGQRSPFDERSEDRADEQRADRVVLAAYVVAEALPSLGRTRRAAFDLQPGAT